MDDVTAYLDDSSGSACSDVVATRSLTCDVHGPWTETTVRVKTGPGRYMLLPSRCPACVAAEQQAAAREEKRMRMWISGTPEWTRR